MGQLVTTVAGGAIGFAIGGPLGAQIGASLGGMVGASLFGPTIKGPRLTDLKVSASTLGAPIPKIYGTVRLGSNMIWSTGLNETKHKSGGKGGPKMTTYTYDASFAVGLCEGTIDSVLRIWADSKLIYDVSGNGTKRMISDINSPFELVSVITAAIVGQKKAKKVNVRIYKGTEEQLPDSLIEADKGVGNVSAHRGLAYLVFEKLQLEDFGNRIPQITVEVTRNLANNVPSLSVTSAEGGSIANITGRQWIPDWETGYLLSMETSSPRRADVIDLSTMKSIYSKNPGGVWGSNRQRLITGAALWCKEGGGGNSRPLEFYDIRNLNHLYNMGALSNSVSGQFDPPGSPQYGALGPVGFNYVPTVAGNKIRLMIYNWTTKVWCVDAASNTPIFTSGTDFSPTFAFPGRTTASEADYIGWRRANGELEVEIFTIQHSAYGEVIPDPSDPDGYQWKQSTKYARRRADIRPFAGESYNPLTVLYDPTDNCIFTMGQTSSSSDTCVAKFDLTTNTFKFVRRHVGLPTPRNDMHYSRIAGGTFGYMYAKYNRQSQLIEVNLQTGDVDRRVNFDNDDFGSITGLGAYQQWDDLSSSLIVETTNSYRRLFFRSGAQKLGVASVVEDVCLKTGILTAEDIDTSELTDSPLVGYIIDRETTARDVLKQLGTAFLFDGYESDYKIKFRSRGSEAIIDIPEDWIGRNDDGIAVRESRTQEIELPRKLSINYYDTERDHQQGTQSSKRKVGPTPTMWTRREDIVELPIVWQPDDAKQAADKLLKMTYANRDSYQFGLPFRYLKYDPTDVITMTLESGVVYTMRLAEMNMGADYTIEASGVSEKAAAYTSTATGVSSPTKDQVIFEPFAAFPIIVNTPLLRDVDYTTDGSALTYVTAGTDATTFSGAFVYMDNGYELNTVAYIADDAIVGRTETILPATNAWAATDEETTIIVWLNDAAATLESVTQEDMLTSYLNAALIGDEVIQFRDAEKQADGSWYLTGILRARRGTNYAVNDHVKNERFVLLDENTMNMFSRSPEEYNSVRDFKAVPPGTLVEDAVVYPTTLSPRDLQPYTPEDIRITDDDTTATLSCQRRSRVTAALTDGTDVMHYKEGDKTSAKMTMRLWAGYTLANAGTGATPTFTLSLPIFDTAGDDLPLDFDFALSILDGETVALVEIYESGVVDGIPKYVELNRYGTDLWNIDELY